MSPRMILIGNLLILALLTGAGIVLKWSGPGFCLGLMWGVAIVLCYHRIKHGFWL